MGDVLTQVDDDGIEHPIVYISWTLSPSETNFSGSELECLGDLWSNEKLRAYVEAHLFTVITDHSALLRIKNLNDPTDMLARWLLQTQQWDFKSISQGYTTRCTRWALEKLYEDGELILVDSFSENVVKKDA